MQPCRPALRTQAGKIIVSDGKKAALLEISGVASRQSKRLVMSEAMPVQLGSRPMAGAAAWTIGVSPCLPVWAMRDRTCTTRSRGLRGCAIQLAGVIFSRAIRESLRQP
jgi:hypothetical protein